MIVISFTPFLVNVQPEAPIKLDPVGLLAAGKGATASTEPLVNFTFNTYVGEVLAPVPPVIFTIAFVPELVTDPIPFPVNSIPVAPVTIVEPLYKTFTVAPVAPVVPALPVGPAAPVDPPRTLITPSWPAEDTVTFPVNFKPVAPSTTDCPDG